MRSARPCAEEHCQSSDCSTSHVCTIQGICPCTGDLNTDGLVDGADIGILTSAWNTTGESAPGSDVNGDGQVNGADLGLLLSAWGFCPWPNAGGHPVERYPCVTFRDAAFTSLVPNVSPPRDQDEDHREPECDLCHDE
jgi:hypothetical protein